MICPACNGEGWLDEPLTDEPCCPLCQGSGIAYCCEGAPIEEPPGDSDAKEAA